MSLRIKIASLEKDIVLIKGVETYKTVVSIDNWDTYFKKIKMIC